MEEEKLVTVPLIDKELSDARYTRIIRGLIVLCAMVNVAWAVVLRGIIHRKGE